MIYDVFTYNGERDILKIHLNVLYSHVDKFIICESKTTFSNKNKPLYFPEVMNEVKEFADKIDYFVNQEDYTLEEVQLAISSPNTRGAEHWTHEFLQKERIKMALDGLDDEDIVFIGDVDEIWQPNIFIPDQGAKLKLRVYTYYLNNRSSEEFWGTFVGRYKHIKNECLNHLRADPPLRSSDYMGWHFTSMAPELKRKLNDSYTEETYNNKWVQDNLDKNIQERKDFLGRDFFYEKDESDWPEYLKKNRALYSHLLMV